MPARAPCAIRAAPAPARRWSRSACCRSAKGWCAAGEKIAILNFGTLLPEAAQAAEALNATLVDMRFVKPLDEQLVLELATSHETLVTLEENAIMGGAGSGVNELLMAKRRPVPVLNLGLPDSFVSQGTGKNCVPIWGWMPPAFSAKSKPGWRSNRHSCLTKRLRLRGRFVSAPLLEIRATVTV